MILHSSSKSDNEYFLNELGVDWYVTFVPDMSQVPDGKNKVPFIIVPVDQSVWTAIANDSPPLTDAELESLGFLSSQEIIQMAQDSPGSYWYIWGEANKYGYMTGSRFAPVFEYFARNLKNGDSTAKIISPSILNWDFICIGCDGYPNGQAWTNEFIDAYADRFNGEKPPVDVWAIDAYPIDWVNTPNNDPGQLVSWKGSNVRHSDVVIDQLESMRQYLNTIPQYVNTPIWITEIAVHVGYDGWHWNESFTGLIPDPPFHWDKMSDYLIILLDWLEANAASEKIEKWFFFTTWKDIVNVGPDGYMGIVLFDGPNQGVSLNCLGDVYRARALGLSRVKCDASGNTVAD